ncbi:MAG: tetratricopeptide repeat protein [Limisphaerales bacterium]
MKSGLITKATMLLALIGACIGCKTAPEAKTRSGVPSGIIGQKLEILTEPQDKEFRNKVEGLTHYLTSRSFEFRGKPNDSLKHLDAAAKADPKQEAVVILAARRYLQKKKTDKAIEILRFAQASNIETAAINEWLGLAYQQANQLDAAIEEFENAIEKEQPTLISIRGLTKIHSSAKRLDKAFEVLEISLKKNIKEAEFWIGIADLYRDTGLAAKADINKIKAGVLASLNKAEVLKPENPLTIHRLADYYKLWGENKKAIRLYVSLIELSPSLVGVREQLAELYLREDKTKDATKQLEAILRSRPTNERALFVLGGIKRDLNKPEEAVSHFETVIKINSKFEPAYYELASIHLFQDRPKKTLEILQIAYEQFKPKFISKFYAGLAYSTLHKFSKSIENLLEAEELAEAGEQNRLTHFFYFQLGAAYERNRQYETASKIFNKALKLSPDYHNAMNYLGYMWADINQNLDEAAKLIIKANELDTDNAAYIDSLGWLYFRQGKYDMALTELLKASELTQDEPDSTIFEHIGDTQHKLGATQKAKEAWQQALDLLIKHKKKLKEPDAYFFEQIGNIYYKLGHSDKAKEAWKRSYEITPIDSIRKKLHPSKKEALSATP